MTLIRTEGHRAAPAVAALAAAVLLLTLALVSFPPAVGRAAPPPPVAAVPPIPPLPKVEEPVSSPQPTHPLEAVDLESWLDGMLPAALKQGQVAGAVISVVKGGQVLLAKGYGYADVAAKTPMDAGGTLIRPGSTSKLFTWTAVMQLAEQGRLDLDADVNRYLDFKVPARFGRPITLADLMTHRAGFAEGLKDALVADRSQLQPLDMFLKRHLPPVLFPPGAVPAYSNYGTALAGYIVQRVSGESYEAYVARHILAPLGMAHSSFRQPLPPALAVGMSKGYMSAGDTPRPFELVSVGPAGALSATATDMARFMIAHLQEGRLGTAQILRPETARRMHEATLPTPAGFDAMAHGFFRGTRNGRVVLEHGGDTIVFHSALELFPAEGVGLFVSFNSRGQGDAVYGMRERLLDGFADRYFPAPTRADLPALRTARDHAQAIAGRYETSRRVQSGFISLFYVLQGQDVVSADPDGTIRLASAPDKAFREAAPYVWQEVGGERMLKLEHVGGTPTIVDSRNPAGVLQAVPLKRNSNLNLPIFAVAMLVLLAAALAWPIAEATRRYHAQPPRLAGRALLARRLARIACVADLAYLVAWFLLLRPILSNQISFYSTGLDPLVRTLQVAAIVPVTGAAAGVWHAWLTVRSARHWLMKAGSVLVAAALIGIVWIAYVGGLMDFTLNY